jgi:hypothetical protein
MTRHLIAVSVALVCCSSFADLTIVKDGKSDYVIVTSPDATPPEKRGAEELQKYLKQMSGAELPIVLAGEQGPPGRTIVVRAASAEDGQNLGTEGFVIRSSGDMLTIAGARPRGTMYGCSTFLEKLGVCFFTPTVTRVPKQSTITIQPINETQTPAFEYREPYFTEAFDRDWAAHIKNNGATIKADASTGGKVTYAQFVHTFDSLIPPSLYAQHPEYFPLVGGKRASGYVQRCLTNPDVLKLAIAGVRKAFADHPDATITSVSQNDTDKWCECDNCKAIVARYGGNQSGIYLWFVNQVAEAIEKDLPDKLIDTLAYQFTENPPTGIAPRKNVRVRLCPISVCEAHPYEQCAAPPNKAFVSNLAAWAKITDTLYIWHYNTDFANYLMPFPDFAQFPDSIRLYQRSGVKGIFFEGDYAPGGGGSDAELRSYVMAKLLWDPKLDASALVDEWMAGVYGPAAKPMRQWFDLLHEGVKPPDRHLFIYSAPTLGYLATPVLAQGDKLFDRAEQFAASDPIAKQYVAKSRLWLRYAQVVQRGKADDTFKQFMSDVRKAGIREMREGQSVDAWEAEFIKAHPAAAK